MTNLKYIIICLIINHCAILKAQKFDYSAFDLHAPMDIPMILAANFGELRTNHFHTGIDIKTYRKTGYNILSVEDGYVSRIKVSPWGYGHVVYIDHYNGLTSVYAHCEEFVGELADLAYQQQEKQQSFEINYYPSKDSLKVKKGQIIAKSGNTGGSTAPHLHFEIRETKTEHALNPLLFNFDIADNTKPTIRGIKVYGLTQEGYRIPNKSKHYSVWGKDGKYYVSGNQIKLDASFVSKNGGIGFSFDAIDKLDDANNVCGINEAFLSTENDTLFSQNMEYISFFSNRQINTHKDYEEYHNRRKHFHKAFKTIHNPLPIYRKTYNNGIINASPGSLIPLKYTAVDAYGNKSEIEFDLIVEEGESNNDKLFYEKGKHIYPDSAYLSYDKTHYILFPPGVLYEPTPLKLNFESNKVKFGSDLIPLQDTYKLMMPILKNAPKTKQYIQRVSRYGTKYSEGGLVKDGWITSRIKSFGEFSVQVDTIAPKISRRNFVNNSNVRGKLLAWRIKDEESGLKNYNIFIDDKWRLLEYEPKKNMFFFKPDWDLKGQKEVTIKAEDNCGNISVETYTLNF